MKSINKRITGKTAVIWGIIFICSYIFMNTIFTKMFMNRSNQNVYLESLLVYSADDLYNLLDCYGSVGRSTYCLYSIIFNFIFPFLCGCFLIVFSNFLYQRIKSTVSKWNKWFILWGAALFIMDWIENIVLIMIIKAYPIKTLWVANYISWLTILKSIVFGAYLAFVDVEVIIWIYQIITKKRKKY